VIGSTVAEIGEKRSKVWSSRRFRLLHRPAVVETRTEGLGATPLPFRCGPIPSLRSCCGQAEQNGEALFPMQCLPRGIACVRAKKRRATGQRVASVLSIGIFKVVFMGPPE